MTIFFLVLAILTSPTPVGPGSGLSKATGCYLAESKRLSRTLLSEREVASKVVASCKEEIDLAAIEMFPEDEALRQKLVVSVKSQVITEVRSLRSSRVEKKGKSR